MMGWAGRRENRREKRALLLRRQYNQIIKTEDRYRAIKSGCLKTRYTHFPMARHIQKKVLKERGVDLRIYYCENCFGYHVTKQIGDDNG